jgi:probable F420-dependent oxidoreductase
MGKRPANLSEVVDFCDKVRSMVRGAQTLYTDCPAPVEFPWASGYELPIWIAAYGPKAIRVAGEHGDGVVLQIAEPMICKWLADQTIKAGVEKERDMEGYQIMAAAPAYIGSMDRCVERTKWFPAMVGNHVADIVERYGPDSSAIPASLAGYIEKRRGYDYQKHGQSDNPFLDFITPDVVADFAVLGSPDQHIEKLRRLKDAGITQFNIYIDNGEEEKLIAEYGKTIIPELRD